MRSLLTLALLLACVASAPGQAAASPDAPGSHSNNLGFTYSIPGNWEVTDTSASLPTAKQQAGASASSEEEKKGLACVQVELTARHGQPASVIVEVALPFDCFGQPMTDADLPGFAAGAAEGLKQSFDIEEPATSTYVLGSHHLWIERTHASPKGHPEIPYTVEITCSLLKKAAVCWMAMAADDASLHTFEQGAVTLDGEAAATLVPPGAFPK